MMSEPYSYYTDAVDRFLLAVEKAVGVSDAAMGVVHTGRQNRALFVFAKMIGHALAIMSLLQQSEPDEQGKPRLLDHASIAVLGRSIVDASIMTMYISDPNLTRNKWQLRRNVLFYHDAVTRKRFLSSMDTQNLAGNLGDYAEAKRRLRTNIKHFASLEGYEEKSIDELLKGIVFVGGVRGAVREAGWPVKQFEWHQSYLSNWVHSYPVSFMRADEHDISFEDPSPYQVGFVGVVLEICSNYIESVADRMAAFTGAFDKDELGHIE